MKMEPTVSSETSAIRTQTPGNYPKRNKLHLEHGESLKTNLEFIGRFSQKSAISDFTKIRSALTPADGQNRRKERHDEANRHYSLFMRTHLKWTEVQGGNCRMQRVPLPKRHYISTGNWCTHKAARILTHGTWNCIINWTLRVLVRLQNEPEFCGKLYASADNRTCVVQGMVSPVGDSGHTAPENFPGVAGLKMFCGKITTPMSSWKQHLNQSDVRCAS